MLNSINFKDLPIKDLFYSVIIVFIMSTILSNLYNPLWGFIYAFVNIIILSFLGWLFAESWSDPTK